MNLPRPSRATIDVDVGRQALTLLEGGRPRFDCAVSTGASGVGEVRGSGRTPLGRHRIRIKIGDGLPEGGEYHDVELAHVNHDGLIDLVACGEDYGVQVWEGTGGSGSPIWPLAATLAPSVACWDAAVGQVNRDGHSPMPFVTSPGIGVFADRKVERRIRRLN